jgi:hypothetical protein
MKLEWKFLEGNKADKFVAEDESVFMVEKIL